MGPGRDQWALVGTNGVIATKMRDAVSWTNLRPCVQNSSQILSAVSEKMRQIDRQTDSKLNIPH